MNALPRFAEPLLLYRRRILLVGLAAGLIALGIAFLLPEYYRASAVLLPETDKAKAGVLNQFAGLASLAGVNVAGTDVSRLYPSIIMSETVLRGVIEKEYQTTRFPQPVSLITYFELDEPTPQENFEKALKTLRDLMTASLDAKTNIVTVTLEMREPELAADALNTVVQELDRFMRLKKITSATEQRKWIDARLKQVEQELRMAEEALKGFRERNRRVADSPQLILEQERLSRELQVKSTIFIELKKQSELSKIEEIKNIPLVNVLDQARAPTRKERPRRGLTAAAAFLLGLGATGTWYVVQAIHGARIKELVGGLRAATRSRT